MRKWFLRVAIVVLSLGVLTSPLPAWALNALLTDTALWLTDTTPTVTKTADLPPNVLPRSSPNDCELRQDPGRVEPSCIVRTTLGTYYNDMFDDGVHGKGYINHNFVYAGDTGLTLVTYSNKLAGFRTMQPGLLTRSNTQHGLQYDYSGQLDFKLLAGNGNPATVAVGSLAFSSNGRYGVVIATAGTGNGIMVFDTETMKGRLIASLTGASVYDQTTPGAGNLAVSDDGRFVASGYSESKPPGVEKGLRVYDTTTCKDQLLIASAKRNNCEYKNIWTGKMRGAQYGDGIQSSVSDAERPLNIRFKDTNTLSFSAIYDYQSATDFKAAKFEAHISDGPAIHLGVLGMGDSYISGEGAYYYRSGTDTFNNRCHTSLLSYPYQQGLKFYPTAKSIACSGATTSDIIFDEDDYKGQVRWQVAWEGRSNKDDISEGFIPGYANQNKFALAYKPQVILLSIGGNDIGFASLVKDCILFSSTCHGTYEDRYEIMQQIVATYPNLVKTYKEIAVASPGVKLYVIGYPQIVATTGSCGLNVHLNDKERLFAVQITTYLNSIIAQAASEAGVRYIDTESIFKGYRLCEAKKSDAAVNGLTVGTDTVGFTAAESYHPTAFGHKLLGAAIAYRTDNFTQKMPVKGVPRKPTVDTRDPLLNVPKTGRPIGKVHWADLTSNEYFLEQGKNTEIDLGGQDIAANTDVQVVLHSDPVVLYEGLVPENGILKLTMPAHIELGPHELHVYVTNTGGETVGIRDSVFVTRPGESNPCKVVLAAYSKDGTPIDVDGDGVNDACDGDYVDPSIKSEGADALPTEEPFIEETPPTQTVDPYPSTGEHHDPVVIIDPMPESTVDPGQGDEPETGITPAPNYEPIIPTPSPAETLGETDQPALLQQTGGLPLQPDGNLNLASTPSELLSIQSTIVRASNVASAQTQVSATIRGQTVPDETASGAQPAVLSAVNDKGEQPVTNTSKVTPAPELMNQPQGSRTVAYVAVASVIGAVALVMYFWRRRQSANI